MRELITKYKNQFLIALILLFTYTPTLIWMWDRWFTRDSYYSHGILIPFITAYLIWQNRSQLMQMKPEKSEIGMKLIILGLFVHLISSLFRVYFSSGFSLVIVIIGLILYFYGEKILKDISFPIVFLFFMVPLPLVVIINISFKMKLFAAQIAAVVLNSMNILAVREGSLIRMANAQVVVDDVCSGLRSLMSLTALGSIFAYWMKGPMWKRLLLFLSTVPIAVITNVCRIILLASVSEIWGSKYATGFIHDLSGFIVFALAFILLYSVSRLME